MWLFLKQTSKFQKYQDLTITIFLFALQSAFIAVFYKFSSNITFGNTNNAFYLGVASAHFEVAVTNRIANFQCRTAFRLGISLPRFLTAPIIDKGKLFVHFVCRILLIYLDYEREQYDQKLFGSYFYSKEQLNKFTDLLENDIPESVIILSWDGLKCLCLQFMQHSHNTLFLCISAILILKIAYCSRISLPTIAIKGWSPSPVSWDFFQEFCFSDGKPLLFHLL